MTSTNALIDKSQITKKIMKLLAKLQIQISEPVQIPMLDKSE